MIETSIIPIEYDKEHEKEALKLKEQIENNSLLFQAFFAGYKKISFLESDDEETISITSIADLKEQFQESIPKYMELLQKQVLVENHDLTEIMFLKMMLLDIFNAHENYNEEFAKSKDKDAHINSVYSIMAAAYYKEQTTPEKLLDFIFNPTSEEKKRIFNWLNNKRRDDLLNHLLDEQYQVLIQAEGEEDVHDPFLKQNLDEVLKISEVDFLGGNIILPSKEEVILPKLTKEELEKLCIEFLIEIDPSLKWLKIYNKLKEDGKIIYGNPYPEEKIDWGCIMTKDDLEILAPLDGTIKDFRYFIHEFVHYISLSALEGEEILPRAIKEYPPIFFEMYASIFLKEKGYPEDAINALFKERNEWTQENMMDISPTLRYLIQTLTEGPITFETEKKKMDAVYKSIPDDLPENMQSLLKALLSTEDERNVHVKIDNEIAFLLQYPRCVVQEYPYIMGKYLATKTLEKVIENPQMMYTILEITENLPKETVEGVINKLGLAAEEFTTPKEKTHQYVKIDPNKQN